MKTVNGLYASMGTTIFSVMTRLALDHDAINLGQGMPEEEGPREIVEEAARHLALGRNQYPPMTGLPELRAAIAAHEARHWNLVHDPATEVVVTSGATEALAAAILALVETGDEVIVFEPLYDAYTPLIERAGGRAVPVRLAPPDWALDIGAVRRALSPRTKAILLNDPMNPAAKVFAPDELAALADLVQEADLYVILDAVYEHLAFTGTPFTPIAALPGMADRTVKIGSAGKIFSLTGWKVGWMTGPAALMGPLARAHQFLTFTTPPNLQAAVAFGLDRCEGWITGLAGEMEARRDRLAAGLSAAGMAVLPSEGTYFLNVRLTGTPHAGRDAAYCEAITRERRVAAIPLSAFYVGAPERDVVRFCFAKRMESLDEAVRRLTA
ncbi:MAG: aminotransferase [Alphaproteobacteria bacterium]|nr:aminotransferase [Alphaproteobacteria bacterium]